MTYSDDPILREQLQKSALVLKIHHLEKVRNRAMALWTGSLTISLILVAIGIMLWNGRIALFGLLFLVPLAVGSCTHAVYIDRIDNAEKKL